MEDPILGAIKLYKNHPATKEIERNGERRNFSFMFTIPTDIGQTPRRLLRTQLFK